MSTKHFFNVKLIFGFISWAKFRHVEEILPIWKINIRENRSGNQEWKTQRHWQLWAHKTQDEDNKKQKTKNKNKMKNKKQKQKQKKTPQKQIKKEKKTR